MRGEMTYSLDIVTDLFCDQLSDVLDKGVLDADLVAVWGGDIVSRVSFNADFCRKAKHTVGRNDSEPCTMQGNRLLDGGVALGLVQAVATRLVERAKGVREEACDVVLAAKRVVLEDLIAGVPGATADDTESEGLSVRSRLAKKLMYTDWVLSPFEVKASSQTSSHQTGEVLVSIQFPNKM